MVAGRESAHLADVQEDYELVQDRGSAEQLLKDGRQAAKAVTVVQGHALLAENCHSC